MRLSLVFIYRNSSAIIADTILHDDRGTSPMVGDDPRWSGIIPDEKRTFFGANVSVETGEFLGYGICTVCSMERIRNPNTSPIHNCTFKEKEVSSPKQKIQKETILGSQNISSSQ